MAIELGRGGVKATCDRLFVTIFHELQAPCRIPLWICVFLPMSNSARYCLYLLPPALTGSVRAWHELRCMVLFVLVPPCTGQIRVYFAMSNNALTCPVSHLRCE